MKLILTTMLLLPYFTTNAQEVGKETGLPIPRFVTLKSNKSNIRKGPNVKYPIIWTYVKKGYPFEVTAEFENWRKLKDVDGSEGWINENLITGRRNGVVINNKINNPKYSLKLKETLLYRQDTNKSPPNARVEFGRIVAIKRCNLQWCKIKVDDQMGWIPKINLWGVYESEIIG